MAFVALFLLITTDRDPAPSRLANYYPISAIYTPYHLTAGGGEKVVLHMVLALQRLTGGRVDLVVRSNNVCKRKACVRKLAEALGVSGIDWYRIRVRELTPALKDYLVWIHMANTLFPLEKSRGVFGVYHCQFPFDYNDFYHRLDLLQTDIETLSTYEMVYLNSKYTAKWYMDALRVERMAYVSRNGNIPTMPSVISFPPPMSFKGYDAGKLEPAQKKNRQLNIILIGRFFEGPQSKHHLDAIRAFKLTIATCACTPQLLLVGHVALGQEEYFEAVKHAARLEHGVRVLADASASELRDALVSADVVWSITGFGTPVTANPADAEHFGIALIEAMAAGVIPVVGSKGGPVEIVDGLPIKLVAGDVEELVRITREVFELPLDQRVSLQSAVIARATELDHFHASFESIFNFVGVQLAPENALFWKFTVQRVKTAIRRFGGDVTKIRSVWNNQEDWRYAAVYVETRYDLAIRGNVLNLLSALGVGWTFHIWHGRNNEVQLKSALEGLDFIVFHPLESIDLGGELDPRVQGTYQMLFKSQRFWESTGDADRVLTFQSDSWFHNKGFDMKWLEPDYIGAPWCLHGNSVYMPVSERPTRDFRMLHTTRQLDTTSRVGNGGVSIRSKQAMLTAIRRFGNESDAQENEDVFAIISLKKANLEVADKDVASHFSLECLCKDIAWHARIIDAWTRLSKMPLMVRQYGTQRFTFAIHKPLEVFNSLKTISGDSEDTIQLFVDTFL